MTISHDFNISTLLLQYLKFTYDAQNQRQTLYQKDTRWRSDVAIWHGEDNTN